MIQIESEHDFMCFAMKYYSNPQLVSVDEFQQDIARICLIKKSIDRFLKDSNVNIRLVINHFVVLGNCFDKGIVPIMKFKFQDESERHQAILKSIFMFFGWIEHEEMSYVQSDPEWNRILKEI